MNYTLMHKNTAVAKIEIDEATNGILKIAEVYRPEHLPVGVPLTGGTPNRKLLNDWWTGRAIPASRSGLREALEAMRVTSQGDLLTKCFGLSLSDQYWVNPDHKPLAWGDVNFFENTFSEDVGNALFGRVPEGAELDLMSPDNTSDGWLKKKWVVADGRRLLVKGGSPPAFQEPLNEVVAAAIMRRLDIAHVPYTLTWDGDQPLSLCRDFITPQTELVAAWPIRSTRKKPGHQSEYQHFLACAEALGIPDMEDSLNKMLAVDYLIANSDRHFNNFGAVRDAETLEWIGAAPVFDCGTSLWHDQFSHRIRPRMEQDSKPFRNKHGEQIKLVTDFSWLDFGALKGVDEEYAEILRESAYIDEARRDALCFALGIRVKLLEEIASGI
jgi:hypothetical protein